jgi:hypothetical protein
MPVPYNILNVRSVCLVQGTNPFASEAMAFYVVAVLSLSHRSLVRINPYTLYQECEGNMHARCTRWGLKVMLVVQCMKIKILLRVASMP